MAIPFRFCLRLPSNLRHDVFSSILNHQSPATLRPNASPLLRSSPLTSSLRFLAQTRFIRSSTRSQLPASSPPPPKPTLKKPPAPLSPTPQDFLASRASFPSSASTSTKRTLEQIAEDVLLYRAPDNHARFYIFSWTFGILMLFLNAFWTLIAIEQNDGLNLWVKISSGLIALFGYAVGATFVLAPLAQIRSITLVQRQAKGAAKPCKALVFQMQRPSFVPNGRKIEIAPEEVEMDRRVGVRGLRYSSVPLERHGEFTASSKPGDWQQVFEQSITDKIVRDGSRMLVREGMAYVRIGQHGNWKLDLQGCEMLDHGRPLEAYTVANPKLSRGLPGLIRRLSSNAV